jgi:streptogrisin C
LPSEERVVRAINARPGRDSSREGLVASQRKASQNILLTDLRDEIILGATRRGSFRSLDMKTEQGDPRRISAEIPEAHYWLRGKKDRGGAMRSRSPALFCIISIAIAVGAGLAAPTVGRAEVNSGIDEIGLYARHEDLARGEAVYEWTMMDAAGAAESAFSEALGGTFGGLVIEHSPRFRVLVFGTDGASAAVVKQIAQEWGLGDILEFDVVERSLATLQKDAEMISHALGRVAEVGTDVRNNLVTVGVPTSDALSVDLPAYARVSIVPHPPSPAQDIYGGAAISACTSGFNIRQGGSQSGTTTAGHCGNTQAWGNFNLPFQVENFNGSNDEQWHTTGQLAAPNRIWVNAGGGFVVITSRIFKANQPIGSWVCKYGATTHDGCGTLDDKNYCATYVPNYNCTYHKLTNDALDLSSGGDSGGPVYKSQSAWGIISGYSFNIHTFCDCNLLYTPINYVESGLSVVVKTAP